MGLYRGASLCRRNCGHCLRPQIHWKNERGRRRNIGRGRRDSNRPKDKPERTPTSAKRARPKPGNCRQRSPKTGNTTG
jgi:hypothetical protein